MAQCSGSFDQSGQSDSGILYRTLLSSNSTTWRIRYRGLWGTHRTRRIQLDVRNPPHQMKHHLGIGTMGTVHLNIVNLQRWLRTLMTTPSDQMPTPLHLEGSMPSFTTALAAIGSTVAELNILVFSKGGAEFGPLGGASDLSGFESSRNESSPFT